MNFQYLNNLKETPPKRSLSKFFSLTIFASHVESSFIWWLTHIHASYFSRNPRLIPYKFLPRTEYPGSFCSTAYSIPYSFSKALNCKASARCLVSSSSSPSRSATVRATRKIRSWPRALKFRCSKTLRKSCSPASSKRQNI